MNIEYFIQNILQPVLWLWLSSIIYGLAKTLNEEGYHVMTILAMVLVIGLLWITLLTLIDYIKL